MNFNKPRGAGRAPAKPSSQNFLNVRALAAQALAPVLEGKESLSATLGPALSACKPVDRGLLQTLVMGTARYALYYQKLIAPLLQRPPAPIIEAVVLIGVHQLLSLRIPDHAAISETVEAVRQLGKDRQTGFVNGVLRAVLRQQDELKRGAASLMHSHPEWMVQRLQKDWPEQWVEILQANNEQGALTLRVNNRETSREEYQARLTAADIESEVCAFSPDGLRLKELIDVTTLPGFTDGVVSVQDEAAQLAAILLDAQNGQRVLDACAAPGGKTAHILERAPSLAELVALDVDPKRCRRIDETLTRLNLKADWVKVRAADASVVGPWAGKTAFDRILLDAPCSATGVIRRHPDIKLLRRHEDVEATALVQSTLLKKLWPLLAPGGRMVYATCSLFKWENEERIAEFLAHTPDAVEVAIEATWGILRKHGRQLLPMTGGHDGFYYCVLEKKA